MVNYVGCLTGSEVLTAKRFEDKIHIVAHSIGNQVLLRALTLSAANGTLELKGKIGELVFASPDVDAGDFGRETERLRAAGMTLYATTQDAALTVSWFANLFSHRAGSVSWGLLSSGMPSSPQVSRAPM